MQACGSNATLLDGGQKSNAITLSHTTPTCHQHTSRQSFRVGQHLLTVITDVAVYLLGHLLREPDTHTVEPLLALVALHPANLVHHGLQAF